MTPNPERLLAIIELQNAIAAAAMNSDEVMRVVADRSVTLTSTTGGELVLVEGEELVVRAVGGTTKLALGARETKESLAGRCVAGRKPVRDGAGSAVPLFYGESTVGALVVTGGTSTEEDLETLRILGQIVAIALHRAYTYPRPRYDNQHDPLTGLGSRRAFEERLAAELGRNKRYGHSFSLALCTLRGLETANDRLGQAAGDEALRVIANILKRHTRVIDACYRLGSESLAIVMPGTSFEGAKIVSERCRAQILDAKLCDGILAPRFGVVEAGDEESDALVARANSSLG